MRGVILTKVRVETEKRNNLKRFIKYYLLKPLLAGISGYLVFFTLLIISNYLGYLIGNRTSFQIDFTDLLLSLLGFVFIFIIRLKENTKRKSV